LIPKLKWRQILLEIRNSLSVKRREEAALHLRTLLVSRGRLLSFFSFQSEIDTHSLNVILASQGRLFLPKREKDALIPYQVTDLASQLQKTSFGLMEPKPELCKRASFDQFDAILVPGLGFDSDHYRLGYGKGYYDRLLAHTKLPAIGVGFQEQAVASPLPKDPWDLPVQELILV
jgi:5-formyltetrahydrofolate cyclo-ligase